MAEIPADLQVLYNLARTHRAWIRSAFDHISEDGARISMWELTAIIERIASLQSALDEHNTWKNETTERLQKICEKLGCHAGQHRLDFLETIPAQVATLKATLERYKQPVTDEEWDKVRANTSTGWWMDLGSPRDKALRSAICKLINSRAQAKQKEPA